MISIIAGQGTMILCCIFYIVWWYRCYRPGTAVDRSHGLNGLLLFLIIVSGFGGIALSFRPLSFKEELLLDDDILLGVTAVVFAVMLAVTLFIFRRKVTSELFIITLWTSLETAVCNRMCAGSLVSHTEYTVGCIVIAVSFIISMIMYVLYYRMEENRAFHAATVPLYAAAFSAFVLLVMTIL